MGESKPGPGLKLVIAGSRTVTPTFEAISEAVIKCCAPDPERDHPRDFISEVVCGDADGADRAGGEWAKSLGIPVWHEPISAEDMKHGKFIGPRMRNRRMANRGDQAIIWWGRTFWRQRRHGVPNARARKAVLRDSDEETVDRGQAPMTKWSRKSSGSGTFSSKRFPMCRRTTVCVTHQTTAAER